jgi:DNA-binding response OmpR family regulator
MSRHVLIIESNKLLARMYQSIFQAMQCSVARAATISEALQLLSYVRADLIILDVRLENGASLEAAQIFRAQLEARQIPVIAMVSRPVDSAPNAMLDSGYPSVMTKPFQVNVFSALARSKMGLNSSTTGAT